MQLLIIMELSELQCKQTLNIKLTIHLCHLVRHAEFFAKADKWQYGLYAGIFFVCSYFLLDNIDRCYCQFSSQMLSLICISKTFINYLCLSNKINFTTGHKHL